MKSIIVQVAFLILTCLSNKAELPQEGILFRTQFPSLGIFINQKSEIERPKTPF